MWMLGIEPGSSESAASALNPQVIFPAPALSIVARKEQLQYLLLKYDPKFSKLFWEHVEYAYLKWFQTPIMQHVLIDIFLLVDRL